jgi:hypothetical protein
MTTQTEIILAMRKSGAPEPPGDFTDTVMQRLNDLPQRSVVSDALFRPRQIGHPANGSKSQTAAFTAAFFLTAFGYLVLAGILHMGFQKQVSSHAIPIEITTQPRIIVTVAVFFMTAGFLSRLTNPLAWNLIKFGLLFFLVFSAVNGIMVQLALNTIFPATGIVLYSVVGLVVGTFLYSRVTSRMQSDRIVTKYPDFEIQEQ